MRYRPFLVLSIALLALTLSGPAAAGVPLTTIAFDEIAAQPIDGVAFGGVTFGFAIEGVPSSDAWYHGAGPGTITSVQDPSLEGSAFGTLTLIFDQPTTVLEFGISRGCICTLPAGASVELLGPGASDRAIATIAVATTPLLTFSEGLFSYSGPAVQKAVITFPSAETAERFALDNLTFHRGNG
jgi:hypothetical protein